MTPKQKIEALLKKTVEAGCPVGEVISANEMAVTLAVKYRIPSEDLVWPALPAGHVWAGAKVVRAEPPKPKPQYAGTATGYVPPAGTVTGRWNRQTVFTGSPQYNITVKRTAVYIVMRSAAAMTVQDMVEADPSLRESTCMGVLRWMDRFGILTTHRIYPHYAYELKPFGNNQLIVELDKAITVFGLNAARQRAKPARHAAAGTNGPPPRPKAAPAAPKPQNPQTAAYASGMRWTKAGTVMAWLNSMPGTAVSVPQIQAMTGWAPHTVRGWVSLQNKSRRANGLPPIKSTRNHAGNLVYYI